MKKIIVKNQNRGSGLMRLNDNIWNNWIAIDGGSINETQDEYIITDSNGNQYKASKDANLSLAGIHNPHIEVDKRNFNLYVGKDSLDVNFILYNFKDLDRRNEFLISSLGGIASGSSIHFKIN